MSERGRVIPHSSEAECGVLGSILINPVRILNLIREQKMSVEDFYIPAHNLIFNAILETERNARGNVVDTLTVAETLKTRNELEKVGGEMYLDKLVDGTPTAAHAGHYIEIVKGKSKRRRLINLAQAAERRAYDEKDDVTDAITEAQASLFEETALEEVKMTTADAIFACYDEYKAASLGKPTGLPCYLPEVNRFLGNFKDGKVHYVAAPPSRGKTTFLNNQAKHWTMSLCPKQKKAIPTGYVSLEMTYEEIIGNIVAEHADVSVFSLKTGAIDHRGYTPRIDKFMEAAKDFIHEKTNADKLPLYINDKMMNIDQICSWARLMVTKHGIKSLCIDYLQLIKEAPGFRGSRKEEVDSICMKLVKLGKDTGLTIVVASQLTVMSRRENRKPRASDLKESGAIEESAYSIMLIYEWEESVWVSIDKNRGGLRREIEVKHEGHRQRFRTMVEAPQEEVKNDREEQSEWNEKEESNEDF